MGTCANLQPTDSPQTELPLTPSVPVSHAKTSATQGLGRGSTGSGQDFGGKLLDWLANYDPATSCWKTSQRCLIEGWAEFSETWPRSGSMRNGTAYRRRTLAFPTTGTASGLLPTPSGVNGGRNHTVGRLDEWGGSSNPWRKTALGKVRCAAFEEWMMGLPTGWSASTQSETPWYQRFRR